MDNNKKTTKFLPQGHAPVVKKQQLSLHTFSDTTVIFVKDGVSFSGSHIDRSCSYSKLSAQLEQNQLALLKSETKEQETELCEELSEVFDGFTESLLSTGPSVDVAELVFQRKLRNQANNKPKRRKL